MQYTAIIQARSGSTRLPGKALLPLEGVPILGHIINRLKTVKKISNLIVATTTREIDNTIVEYLEKNNIDYYRGSEENVLERFYQASRNDSSDAVIRATADNPLLDLQSIDDLVRHFESSDFNYADCMDYPIGTTVEVFKKSALEEAFKNAESEYEFEHVTPYIYLKMDKITHMKCPEDLSKYRFTIDTPEDYELATRLFHGLYPGNNNFSIAEAIEYLQKHPDLMTINNKIRQKKLGE